MSKFFYISFIGIKREIFDAKKLFGSTGPKEESWKESEGPEDEPDGMFKVPMPDYYSMTIESQSGMFIPAAIEDYIKKHFSLDSVCIQAIKEMTQDEFDSQTEYMATRDMVEAKISVAKKPKIDPDVQDELDSLLSLASSGKLNVLPPPADCEEPESEYGDLFKPLDEDE